MLLEEGRDGCVVVFNLEAGEFVQDRGAGLIGQLGCGLDPLLLRLELLLERLDFRLDDYDLVLLALDAMLQPAVSKGCENNKDREGQCGNGSNVSDQIFYHWRIIGGKRFWCRCGELQLECYAKIGTDNIVQELPASEIHIVENRSRDVFSNFRGDSHATEDAVAVGGGGLVVERGAGTAIER